MAWAGASEPFVRHAVDEAVGVPVADLMEVELASWRAISSRLRHGFIPSFVMQVEQATRMNGGPDMRSTATTTSTCTTGSQQ
jgi:hypothetical protein